MYVVADLNVDYVAGHPSWWPMLAVLPTSDDIPPGRTGQRPVCGADEDNSDHHPYCNDRMREGNLIYRGAQSDGSECDA